MSCCNQRALVDEAGMIHFKVFPDLGLGKDITT
jgi:hypothetical protein